jgi:hypothetical protein
LNLAQVHSCQLPGQSFGLKAKTIVIKLVNNIGRSTSIRRDGPFYQAPIRLMMKLLCRLEP